VRDFGGRKRRNQTEAFSFLIIVAMVGLMLSMECRSKVKKAEYDTIHITICMYRSMYEL